MNTSIIKVGNGCGIKLPSSMLKRLNLVERSPIQLFIESNHITIRPTSRAGWEEAAMKMSQSHESVLLIPDVFEDETDLNW